MGDEDVGDQDAASPVPPDTWVFRGGELANPSREKNLRAVHEAYGIWGICASGEPGKSHDEVAAVVQFHNRRMVRAMSQELQYSDSR